MASSGSSFGRQQAAKISRGTASVDDDVNDYADDDYVDDDVDSNGDTNDVGDQADVGAYADDDYDDDDYTDHQQTIKELKPNMGNVFAAVKEAKMVKDRLQMTFKKTGSAIAVKRVTRSSTVTLADLIAGVTLTFTPDEIKKTFSVHPRVPGYNPEDRVGDLTNVNVVGVSLHDVYTDLQLPHSIKINPLPGRIYMVSQGYESGRGGKVHAVVPGAVSYGRARQIYWRKKITFSDPRYAALNIDMLKKSLKPIDMTVTDPTTQKAIPYPLIMMAKTHPFYEMIKANANELNIDPDNYAQDDHVVSVPSKTVECVVDFMEKLIKVVKAGSMYDMSVKIQVGPSTMAGAYSPAALTGKHPVGVQFSVHYMFMNPASLKPVPVTTPTSTSSSSSGNTRSYKY